jgi:hypothetical protein
VLPLLLLLLLPAAPPVQEIEVEESFAVIDEQTLDDPSLVPS